MQFVHQRDRGLRVAHRGAFGQFQLEEFGRQRGLFQHFRDHLRQSFMMELHRRQVDRNGLQRQAGIQPFAGLPHRLAQRPFADRLDQAGLFGDPDEFVRADHAQVRMVEAQQRLGAGHLAGLEVDLRLVLQEQLATLQAGAQRGLDLQVAHRQRLHLAGIEAETAAVVALGAVHCTVGLLQQFVKALGVTRIQRDADRRGDGHLELLDSCRLPHHVQQLLRHHGGAVRIGVGQHHDEFVAAEARQRVVIAHRVLQAVGQLHQQGVADAVAEGIIDVLEAVDVDEQQRHAGAGAVGARQQVVRLFLQLHAVRQ